MYYVPNLCQDSPNSCWGNQHFAKCEWVSEFCKSWAACAAKNYLTDTVSGYKKYLTDTVSGYKKYLTDTVSGYKMCLTALLNKLGLLPIWNER